MNLNSLKIRLSIIIKKEGYTFLNTLSEFQVQLKKYFKEDYPQDEIEDALKELQETFIFTELDEEVAKDNPEIPEDF